MDPKSWVEAVFELIWRLALRVAAVVIIVYLVLRVRWVIVTVLLAAVLTYAVLPIVDFLCTYRVRGVGRRFQRVMATILVFVMLGTVLVVIGKVFLGPFWTEFGALAGSMQQYFSVLQTDVLGWYRGLPPDLQNFLQAQRLQSVLGSFGAWGKAMFDATYVFCSRLWEVILIPVLAFYFALDSRTLKREFAGLVPRRKSREVLAIVHEASSIMRSYVTGQIILCIIAGVLVGVMLKALNMPYALLLGVFAGVTRAIPVLGPVVSGLTIVLLGVARAPVLGLYLFVFFVVLQFAESKIIMPYLIGERVKLHPAVVILVLLIGAELFGILGMFLAAPVTAILRVLVRYYLIKPKKMRVWGLPRRARRTAAKGELPEDVEPAAAVSRE
ncbi:MAG TPA: AI-2E family transporter [Armatimonadota bacterium]|nr:AI-2E family transporter [Armatimonadota bacterium]